MNIIHIFGTPRSGSTLMQKILNTSKHTSTLPETWFLLHGSSYRLTGGFNQLGFNATSKGVSTFLKNIQICDEFQLFYDFYRDLLCRKIDTKYFIEKTPRNILLIHDIMRCIQPEDKVILVRRNSKEIFESYLDYFDKFPYIKSYKYFKEIQQYNDIIEEAVGLYGEKIFVVDFESVIHNKGDFLKEIRNFLGLPDLSLDNLIDIGGLDDYGDKRMSGYSHVVQKRNKRSKYINKLSGYFYESRFSLFSVINFSLAYIVFRYNVNLISHMLRKSKFIH